MKITLTPEAERLIQEQLQNGKYASADEVILAAIRLLAEQERFKRLYKGRLEDVKQEIAIGAEQLDQGRQVDGKQVLQRLIEKNQRVGA